MHLLSGFVYRAANKRPLGNVKQYAVLLAIHTECSSKKMCLNHPTGANGRWTSEIQNSFFN